MKQGKGIEFWTLAEPQVDALYRTARRLTKKPENAEDLVQETFLKAYKNFGQYESGTNFKAWIFKILINAFRNYYRKITARPKMADIETVGAFYAAHAEDLFATVPAPGLNVSRLLPDEVKNAIDAIPDEFSEVVVLALVEGFSYKEVSDMLDIPIGTVMSRLFRGRQLLKQSLADYAKSMGYVRRSQP